MASIFLLPCTKEMPQEILSFLKYIFKALFKGDQWHFKTMIERKTKTTRTPQFSSSHNVPDNTILLFNPFTPRAVEISQLLHILTNLGNQSINQSIKQSIN